MAASFQGSIGESDADDDDLLATSMEDLEEGNRGHLFEFQLTPGSDRRVRRFGVRRRVFDATLQPRTDLLHPPHVDAGYKLERALSRAIDREIRAQQLNDDDHVLFTLQHPTFTHAFQSFHVPVGEWHEQSQRVTLLLQKKAEKLNSNERFQPDDRLKVQLTTVQHPGTGSSRRKENTPGHLPLATFLNGKTSVVHVRNQDKLCCARAIVTMQAWADEQPPRRCTPPVSFRALKMGRDAQTQLAKALHAEARVPEGPCGLGAFEQFQIVLPDHFIKVVSAELGFQVIFGRGEKQDHQRYVLLLKHDHHYYGLKSLSALFGRSYYCHVCDKGYDHEDFEYHPCVKRRCVACKQKDCRDYRAILSSFDKPPRPTQVPCLVCHRCFYGPTASKIISRVHPRETVSPSTKTYAPIFKRTPSVANFSIDGKLDASVNALTCAKRLCAKPAKGSVALPTIDVSCNRSSIQTPPSHPLPNAHALPPRDTPPMPFISCPSTKTPRTATRKRTRLLHPLYPLILCTRITNARKTTNCTFPFSSAPKGKITMTRSPPWCFTDERAPNNFTIGC